MSHLYRVRHSTMGTSLWTACCLVSYGLLLFLNFVHSTKTKLICPPVDEYDCVMYCLYSGKRWAAVCTKLSFSVYRQSRFRALSTFGLSAELFTAIRSFGHQLFDVRRSSVMHSQWHWRQLLAECWHQC